MKGDAAQEGEAALLRDRLRADWLTVWQSEAAALAADREGQEIWATCVARWTEQWAGLMGDAAALGFWRGWAELLSGTQGAGADGPDGPAGSAAPPGPPAVGAAPDDLASLDRRIAELERRLAPGGD